MQPCCKGQAFYNDFDTFRSRARQPTFCKLFKRFLSNSDHPAYMDPRTAKRPMFYNVFTTFLCSSVAYPEVRFSQGFTMFPAQSYSFQGFPRTQNHFFIRVLHCFHHFQVILDPKIYTLEKTFSILGADKAF